MTDYSNITELPEIVEIRGIEYHKEETSYSGEWEGWFSIIYINEDAEEKVPRVADGEWIYYLSSMSESQEDAVQDMLNRLRRMKPELSIK